MFGNAMGKMKAKIIGMSIMVAMITGVSFALVTLCIQNRKCITKKAKKAFRQLEHKLDV